MIENNTFRMIMLILMFIVSAYFLSFLIGNFDTIMLLIDLVVSGRVVAY